MQFSNRFIFYVKSHLNRKMLQDCELSSREIL